MRGALRIASVVVMSDAVTALVDKFVSDLRKVIRDELVQMLLANGEARDLPKPPRQLQVVRAPGKRTVEMIEEQGKAIVGFLKKNPNSSAQEIGTALGLTIADLALPIARLKAERQIKSAGVRRGTRYSVR